MRYLSVCAGIEAATVAWHDLGWKAAAYSEIEKFPCEVLKHHYPDVPNVGDMTKFEEWDIGTIELLVGGTPCQSFSVAGLRKGLDDPRGNLMLTYGAIAKRFRPKWLVWENVPGVLSSNEGRDFGTFLGMLGELGYGFAYRVLDAQYFGVAQRRRRVFVIGCLGDWRSAAAVLFERDSLCGNPAPRRTQRERAPGFFESSLAQYRQDNVGGTLKASGGVLAGGSETLISNLTYEWHNQDSRITPSEIATTLSCNAGGKEGNLVQPIPYDLQQVTSSVNHQYARKPGDPCHTLAKENAHGSAVVYSLQGAGHTSQNSQGSGINKEVSFTLNCMDVHGVAIGTDLYNGAITGNIAATMSTKGSDFSGTGPTVMQPIAYNISPGARELSDDIHISKTQQSKTLDASASNPTMHQGGTAIVQTMAVRRLLPIECERLQGFPDNYTNIKENCPDGPRYKALGNSMAVPVMKWIGRRIQQVEEI